MERSEHGDDKLELPEDAYSETKVNWKGKALKAIGTKIQKKKSRYSKWRDSNAIGKKTENAKIMVDKMGRHQGDWESPKTFSHHRKNARPVPMVNLTRNHSWDRPLIEVVSTNPFATTNILYVDRTFATLLLRHLHKAWRSSKSPKQEAEPQVVVKFLVPLPYHGERFRAGELITTHIFNWANQKNAGRRIKFRTLKMSRLNLPCLKYSRGLAPNQVYGNSRPEN